MVLGLGSWSVQASQGLWPIPCAPTYSTILEFTELFWTAHPFTIVWMQNTYFILNTCAQWVTWCPNSFVQVLLKGWIEAHQSGMYINALNTVWGDLINRPADSWQHFYFLNICKARPHVTECPKLLSGSPCIDVIYMNACWLRFCVFYCVHHCAALSAVCQEQKVLHTDIKGYFGKNK